MVLVCDTSRFDPGDWAVYSFFVLSGYWIHRMWTDKYSRTDSPALVFMGSRLARLLPVFLLANAVSALVQRHNDPLFLHPASQGWPWALALASNLVILGYTSLPHSQGALHVAWSLDIEIQFYIAFPLAMALWSRARSPHLWRGIAFAACAAALVIYLLPVVPQYRNIACCGIFFLTGAAAAQSNWRPSESQVSVIIWAAVGFVALCWIIPEWRFLFENDKHGATPVDLHHKRIAQALLALFTAPVALFTVTRPSGPRDRALGEFTYVVYLMHWPVVLIHSFYFVKLPPLSRLPSIIGAWLVVALVSWVVFKYFDQPIERARKRWVSGRMAPHPLPERAGG